MKAQFSFLAGIRLALAALALWAPPCVMVGQLSSSPRADFPITDGPVHAIVETNGVVYLGGDFSNVSLNETTTAVLDVVNGLAEAAFPAVSGVVYTAIPDGQGGWYLGGRFDFVGDQPRANLARILAGNTLDPHWNPGANDVVHALALSGGVVYVGGQFTNIAGQVRRNLAALDAVTGAAAAWNPNVCCDVSPDLRSKVLALEVDDGLVYAGGSFSRVGGALRQHVAAVDAVSGVPVPWPERVAVDGHFVSALRISGGTLLVGGRFQEMGGAPRNNLAALGTGSGVATDWNPGVDGDVLALLIRGTVAYAAGGFTVAGGQARARMAAFDLNSGVVTPWNPAADGPVTRMDISGGMLYAGGDFTSIGGQPRTGLAALDANSGLATDWTPAVVGSRVRGLAVNGGRILASSESHREAQPRNRLAALDARTGRLLDWNPDADDTVFALAFANGQIFAAGDFLHIGGISRSRLAAIAALSGETVPWETELTGPNGRVLALAIGNDRVYAAGGFSSVGATFSPGLAAFDLATGAAVGWRPTANRTVLAIDMSGDTVYAAGNFTSVGGQSRRAFAALDAFNPALTSWNPNTRGNGAVGQAIVRADDVVYVGGSFTNIGGQTRRHLAALDAANATATAWNPQLGSVSNAIQKIAVAGDAVYVAGSFSVIGGKNRRAVAALDRSTAAALGWSPNPRDALGDAPVTSLAAGQNAVYLGGTFQSMGGAPHKYFAAFGQAGHPVFTLHPVGGIVQRGQAIALTAAATGQQPISYQWQWNGTNIDGATGAGYFSQNAQSFQSGIYTVIASNALGVTTSSRARLVVADPIVVTRPLANTSVQPGTNITFSLGVTANPPPRYQWKLNGVPMPGETSSDLRVTNAQATNSGIYSVVIFNGLETIETPRIALSVAAPFVVNADAFTARSILSNASGTISGHNGSGTREPGEPLHAGKTGGRSIWYSWIAPVSGIATFSTVGSAFDTLLAVYTNTAVSGTNLIASDDDRGGFLTSLVMFNAVAGREYQIAVDGYAVGSGRVVLSWNLEATSQQVPSILSQPAGQTVPAGGNAILSVSATASGGIAHQWLQNGRPVTGATNASLLLTNLRASRAGQYSVRVRNGPRETESQPAAIEIGPLSAIASRDKFQDLFLTNAAAPVSVALGTAGAQIFNNTGAGTQSLEPNHGNAPGGSSKWFRFRAATNAVLQLDTLGSGIDTTLGVYIGTNLAALSLVARDNNGAIDGKSAFVRFNSNPLLDYVVAVDGFDGAQGGIQLNWRLGLPPVVIPASINPVVRIGGVLTLNAGGTGAVPPPVYQWWFGGSPLAGATNSTLTLSNFQAAQAGGYSVVISNFAGTVTNNVAVVSFVPFIRLNQSFTSLNGRPVVRLTGPLTNRLVVEASANLSNWVELQSLEYSVPLDFTDTNSSTLPRRFYRGLITPVGNVRPGWITNSGRRIFRINTPVNQSLVIEAATNLNQWLPLFTNSFTVPINFTDFDSTNVPARFYRVRQ